MCDVRWTSRRYETQGWLTLDLALNDSLLAIKDRWATKVASSIDWKGILETGNGGTKACLHFTYLEVNRIGSIKSVLFRSIRRVPILGVSS